VRVVARNLAGESEASAPATFSARAPGEPMPPTAVRRDPEAGAGTADAGDAVVAVTWDCPLDNGGSPLTD